MKRRSFLKKTGTAGIAALTAPYILPTGRLFARTGERKIEHVVFFLWAGGVRNRESIHKAEGNLMPHILSGNETITDDVASGLFSFPGPTGKTLQEQGTLFTNFKLKGVSTGHYMGHIAAVTGDQPGPEASIGRRPSKPTISQYFDKHTSPQVSALKNWVITSNAGFYTSLNGGTHPDYQSNYGNYFSPAAFVRQNGRELMGNPINFNETELNSVESLKSFCNDNFIAPKSEGFISGIKNSLEEQEILESFLKQIISDAGAGNLTDPYNIGSVFTGRDLYTTYFTEQIIKTFQPSLTVLNVTTIDDFHGSFYSGCAQMHECDFAAGHLWETIQNDPVMRDNTIMVICPEHGRNAEGNVTGGEREASDHTTDEARDMFALVVGPEGVVHQNKVVDDETSSNSTVPFIANILGFDQDIPVFLPENHSENQLLQSLV